MNENTLPTAAQDTAAVSDIRAAVEGQTIWAANVCKMFRIDTATLIEAVEAFALHCSVMEYTHPNETDTRRHFVSWFRIYQRENQKAAAQTAAAFDRYEQNRRRQEERGRFFEERLYRACRGEI